MDKIEKAYYDGCRDTKKRIKKELRAELTLYSLSNRRLIEAVEWKNIGRVLK